jgi:hypothetical protein
LNGFKPRRVRYLVNIDIPGNGECVDIISRWHRQFPGGITQTENYYSTCLLRASGNWHLWLERTVPTNAQFGEASFEVQVELV